MNNGKTIFAQLMEFLPSRYEFNNCVERYDPGQRMARDFSYWDQLLCMMFAQLAYRESLRDLEICLRSQGNKIYHMGFRGNVSRSTLSYANLHRDSRIFEDYAKVLIAIARALYGNEALGYELAEVAYALDATVIQTCLSLCPWAPFRGAQGGIKMHTLLDLKNNIPTFVAITSGKIYELSVLDELLLEPGAFYVMDRGYLDYARLYRIDQCQAFFVIRAKKDIGYQRVYSRVIDKTSGLRVDQTIRLTNDRAIRNYPDQLRLVKFYDAASKRRFIFLTNNFDLPALTVANLYRSRWQIETFFRWIKQNLRIKSFLGTSENAVRTQIWIAMATYVLIAIARKRLKLDHLSLYSVLQIFSVCPFDKRPILQLFHDVSNIPEEPTSSKQLILC